MRKHLPRTKGLSEERQHSLLTTPSREDPHDIVRGAPGPTLLRDTTKSVDRPFGLDTSKGSGAGRWRGGISFLPLSSLSLCKRLDTKNKELKADTNIGSSDFLI